MEKVSFETFKGLILDKARFTACSSEFSKAYRASSWEELLGVIKSNAGWCYRNIGVNGEFLSQVPDDILLANGIYVNKQGVEQREGLCLYYGNSTSQHFNNSVSRHYDNSTSTHYHSSTSEHCGNSTSEHYDNSLSRHLENSISKHCDNSISRHYDKSLSRHFNNSISKHYGNSISVHYDNSTSTHCGDSTSEHYDNSTSTHYDNSASTYYSNGAYGSVAVLKDTSVIHGSAIVRERSSGKVYCKKHAAEIVILEG